MRALLLAFLLVLAGCSSGPSGTVTPSPVSPATDTAPTDDTVPTSFEHPPGYGESGVTNASRALAANERALGESYRLVIDQTHRVNGTSGELRYTWTEGPDAAHANYTTSNGTAWRTHETWNADGATYANRAAGSYPPDDLPSQFLTLRGDVRAFPVTGFLDARFRYAESALGLGNHSTRVVERNGTTLLRVHTTTPPETPPEMNITYHDYETTLWVDSEGLVRRVESHTDREAFGQRIVTNITARIEPSDGPERPAWLDSTANVTAEKEDGLLVVTHHGGPEVAFADYYPIVGDSGSSRTAPLNGSLAPRDTIYVFYSDTARGLTAARDRPSEDEYRPQSGTLRFEAGNETVGVNVADS